MREPAGKNTADSSPFSTLLWRFNWISENNTLILNQLP